jgi:hypothetical protein
MSDDVWCAKPTTTNNTREIKYESNDENEHVSVVRLEISTVLSDEAKSVRSQLAPPLVSPGSASKLGASSGHRPTLAQENVQLPAQQPHRRVATDQTCVVHTP